MPWLSALLLGVSTNLDNLFLGLSFGLAQKRVSAGANWIIGLFSAAATCLFCCLSSLCTAWGPAVHRIGGGCILLIGLWTLLPERRGQCRAVQGTAALGAALAVNCIPVAFGAGLAGIHPAAAAISVGLLSVLAIRLGNFLGLRAGVLPVSATALRILGGVLLAVLGLLELFL